MSIIRVTEDLLRQRRNVILASCVIWFFHFGNVSVTSVTYSDIDFKIEGKNSVYIAMWIFYFYSILRFFVYFVEEGWEQFKCSFVVVFDDRCQLSVFKRQNIEYIKNDFTVKNMSLGKGGFKFEPYMNHENNNVIIVSYVDMLPVILASIFTFVFLRTAVTDYVFPFLLAVFVLYNSGFSGWKGSLINII